MRGGQSGSLIDGSSLAANQAMAMDAVRYKI